MKIKLWFQERTFTLDVEPQSTVKELSILAKMVLYYYLNNLNTSVEKQIMQLDNGNHTLKGGTLEENCVVEGSVIKVSLHNLEILSIDDMIQNLVDQHNNLYNVSDEIQEMEIFQLLHNYPTLTECDLSNSIRMYSFCRGNVSNEIHGLLKLLSMGLQLNTHLNTIRITKHNRKEIFAVIIIDLHVVDDDDVGQLCDGLRNNIGVKTLHISGKNFSTYFQVSDSLP
jgi:hypothetical protein